MPTVCIDIDSIGDAVRNLLDNAIKYSPAGAAVDLTVCRDGNNLSISVGDRGIGVDPRETTRLFQPFYRGKRGDQANVQGTGLGLALVKAAAEAHGGSVHVTGLGQRGSRFTLLLPIPQPGLAENNRRALTWHES
jgi:signal transduction histidine kinase